MDSSSSSSRERGRKAAAATARRIQPLRPLPQFDRLIHEQVRLAIVSALAVNESLSFNELKALLNTTDGNLSVHARKLEDAHYITCTKFFQGRTPKSEFRLTAHGRRAFNDYLDRMEGLIRSSRQR